MFDHKWANAPPYAPTRTFLCPMSCDLRIRPFFYRYPVRGSSPCAHLGAGSGVLTTSGCNRTEQYSTFASFVERTSAPHADRAGSPGIPAPYPAGGFPDGPTARSAGDFGAYTFLDRLETFARSTAAQVNTSSLEAGTARQNAADRPTCRRRGSLTSCYRLRRSNPECARCASEGDINNHGKLKIRRVPRSQPPSMGMMWPCSCNCFRESAMNS